MTDLRYAIRMLLKSPGFSATAIFVLALGIGATTAMFGVIYAFLLRPLPFAQPEQLVMLQSRNVKSGVDAGVNYLDYRDWQQQAQSFAGMAFFNLRWNGNLQTRDGSTQTLKTTFTAANLFSLLGVEPKIGRNFMPADDEPNAAPVILISDRVWRTTFGGAHSIIGREVQLDGSPRTIIGVMPPGFRFPSQSDLWIPAAKLFGGNATNRTWRADQAIGRLKLGAALADARAEMDVIAERLTGQFPESNKDIGSAVVSLREHWTGEVRTSLVVLLAACGGVLLIACANVGQLLLARASSRQRELLVRAALGASRWRLARQLLTESVVLTLLGSVAGSVLAYWLVDLVAASIPVELPFWIRIDVNPAVLAFTALVSCIVGVAAGSLPAWNTIRIDVSESLKSSGAGNTGATETTGRARDLLTAAQVAVSLLLLVSAGLVLRSMMNLRAVDPGFDARNVLMFEVNPTYRGSEPAQVRVDRFAHLLDRLAQMPGVEAAAANNSPPFVAQRPWNRSIISAEGQPAAEQNAAPTANFQTVSSEYFALLRIPLLRGRPFDARDHLQVPYVCIVGETLAARLWPDRDPIGQRVLLGRPEGKDDDWMTVVGVVRDVRHQGLGRAPGPDIYKPTSQLAWKQLHFLIRAREGVNVMSLIPLVQREITAAEPEVGAFNFTSLEAEVDDSLWQPRLRGWLLSFFSIVALLLAATGLYGVIAYRVTQRTLEIGIRIALGATRAAIARLMLRSALRAVLLGLAVGIAAAAIAARLLQASLFGIVAADVTSFAAACVLFIVVGALACWLPTRRATRVDPVSALRTE